MRIIICLLIALIGSVTHANGQKTVKGSGYVLTQQKVVPIYNSIEIDGTLNVFISPDELRPVIIEADNNLFPYIQTQIKKDTLKIFIVDSVYIEKYAAMNIFLSTPHISNIKITSGTHLDGSHLPWKNKQTNIEASGNVEIKWHTSTQTLNIVGENNASIWLKGDAEQLNLSLNQGSQLEANELNTQNANIILSNRSQAIVEVSKTIHYDLSRKSKLILKGSPKILQSYLISGARVIKKNRKQ